MVIENTLPPILLTPIEIINKDLDQTDEYSLIGAMSEDEEELPAEANLPIYQ